MPVAVSSQNLTLTNTNLVSTRVWQARSFPEAGKVLFQRVRRSREKRGQNFPFLPRFHIFGVVEMVRTKLISRIGHFLARDMNFFRDALCSTALSRIE